MPLTVVIPAFNASALLHETLPALQQGTRIPDEILVVDDASTDDTARAAEEQGARVLRLTHNRGPAFSRNYAASQASGEILIFLDADTRVNPDTLALLEARLVEDPTLSAVIGAYDDQPSHPGIVSQYRNLAHRFVHCTSEREARTFWSGCGAVRKHAMLAAGGFCERYRRPSIEDIELGYRLTDEGGRILLDPAITVTHLKEWTFSNAVSTDLFDRGIPWMELLLARGSMPDDLNISIRYRLSAPLTAMSAALALASLHFGTDALALAFSLSLIVCALHAGLFVFLAERKGIGFLFPAVLLFALQQMCSLAAAATGTLQWMMRGMPSHQASVAMDLEPGKLTSSNPAA